MRKALWYGLGSNVDIVLLDEYLEKKYWEDNGVAEGSTTTTSVGVVGTLVSAALKVLGKASASIATRRAHTSKGEWTEIILFYEIIA